MRVFLCVLCGELVFSVLRTNLPWPRGHGHIVPTRNIPNRWAQKTAPSAFARLAGAPGFRFGPIRATHDVFSLNIA